MSLRIAAAALVFSAASACAEEGQWDGVWLDGYKDGVNAGFDPEKLSAVVGVDRTNGDVFLCGWSIGVWKSSDGGKLFARVDNGKICGPGCGPIQPNSIKISPDGPLMTFKYDASTGKLSEPCVVKETKGGGSPIVVFDEKNGFLYTGGGDFGIVADGLTVLKVDRK